MQEEEEEEEEEEDETDRLSRNVGKELTLPSA
jgi:hypothetical protein